MTKFTLTSSKFEGEIIIKYALNGYLMHFENRAELSQEQIDFFYKHFPIHVPNLRALLEKSTNLKALEVKEIPSFEAFWDAYGLKIDKPLAKKQWDKLSEADKVNAMEGIKKYDRYLTLKGIAKVYAVRYLHRRSWENEF